MRASQSWRMDLDRPDLGIVVDVGQQIEVERTGRTLEGSHPAKTQLDTQELDKQSTRSEASFKLQGCIQKRLFGRSNRPSFIDRRGTNKPSVAHRPTRKSSDRPVQGG